MKKIFSLVVAMVLSIGATVSAQSIQGELVLGLNIADVDASGASSRVGFNQVCAAHTHSKANAKACMQTVQCCFRSKV